MSKGKQLWPGDTMRAFFRAHIRRETALDDATTERLAEALNKAVNRMLVWEMPEAGKDNPAAGRTSAPSNLADLAQPAERHAEPMPSIPTSSRPSSYWRSMAATGC